jgi:hypothetical protein
MVISYKMMMKIKFKCLICGRCNFDRPQPHRCVGGFRKRKLKWEKINDLKTQIL